MSAAVEKTWLLEVGIVVLRVMSGVATDPKVSMPRVRGGDVQQEHVLHIALQHAGLDGSANGHHLIRVHALVGLLAKELLHLLVHGGAYGSCRPPEPPR